MPSSNEKLLPIVAGCRALVTAEYFTGREVLVREMVTAEYAARFLHPTDIDRFLGTWVCQVQHRGVRKMACIPEAILMRIDGYDPKMQADGLTRLIDIKISLGGGRRGKLI